MVCFPLSYMFYSEDQAHWRDVGLRDAAKQRALDPAYCAYLSSEGVPCLEISENLIAAA